MGFQQEISDVQHIFTETRLHHHIIDEAVALDGQIPLRADSSGPQWDKHISYFIYVSFLHGVNS